MKQEHEMTPGVLVSGEVLSAGDARARVAVLEAELAELRKRVCVPEGWRVVPVEPTIDMSAAARRESRGFITFGEAEQVYRSMIAAAPACPDQAEPLYITHRPLIQNAINLLGVRRPVAPDVELVINGLRAMLDGMPTPAETAAEHWILAAHSAAPAPAERVEQESVTTESLDLRRAYEVADKQWMLQACPKDVFRFALIAALQDNKLYTTPQPAPTAAQDVAGLPFVRKILEKLERFRECAEDDEGVDIGCHWLDVLTRLGLLNRVQRSPARWEMTAQADDALEAAHQQREG